MQKLASLTVQQKTYAKLAQVRIAPQTGEKWMEQY
jgi:hypothetical protein